jgi:small subunit ribosomal protein S6
MRDYEAMFVFHPDLAEEKLNESIKAVEKIIQDNAKGRLHTENLGKKTLAFPIRKLNEGYYVNYDFEAPPAAIEKIKAGLKHSDDILRFVIFMRDTKK